MARGTRGPQRVDEGATPGAQTIAIGLGRNDAPIPYRLADNSGGRIEFGAAGQSDKGGSE